MKLSFHRNGNQVYPELYVPNVDMQKLLRKSHLQVRQLALSKSNLRADVTLLSDNEFLLKLLDPSEQLEGFKMTWLAAGATSVSLSLKRFPIKVDDINRNYPVKFEPMTDGTLSCYFDRDVYKVRGNHKHKTTTETTDDAKPRDEAKLIEAARLLNTAATEGRIKLVVAEGQVLLHFI
jgi:hypothetical protein